ncbi:MAG: hypothetical protein K2R98_12095 [Gemmataceae bacterium]|nr:hypothetical protein [Gemmataceae bacterium]
MTSYFDKCPQCGAIVAKGMTCPRCHYSESAPEGEPKPDVCDEYRRRVETHTRHYAIYMVMMIGLGFAGVINVVCWFLFMFRGSVLAFFVICFLFCAMGVLGYLIKKSKEFFPTEYTCPACDLRLDEMPLNGDYCPGCHIRLRGTPTAPESPQGA